MLKKKDRTALDQIEFVSAGCLVPENHFLRAVQASINFDFIYDEVKDLYSESSGRPSIDPVVLIKLIMLQALYGIRSMRQTIQDVEVNVAYRWFLGYGLQEKIPHFSTFGKNYERRFKESDLFEQIFVRILMEAIECGFVKTDAVFIDATHVKANANKNKYVKKMAQHRAHKYKRELMIEINADRQEHGKKPFDDDNDDDMGATEESKTKTVKESTTDSESGLFCKGEKERCFAYTTSVACDKSNFILGLETTPGNVHDSQVFSQLFQKLLRMPFDMKSIVVDSGYKTPGICREIALENMLPVMPYKRPMTKEGYFKKYEYAYDEYYDCYICPNNQVLKYSTTNRDGYREYKSNPLICASCSMITQCTNSKNATKVVTRHVWEPYVELAEDIRHTTEGRQLYKQRCETIERVFADAKEKHGMRYTRYRGLRKVNHYLTLLFACMNLKKLAMWKKRRGMLPTFSSRIASFLTSQLQNALLRQMTLLSRKALKRHLSTL